MEHKYKVCLICEDAYPVFNPKIKAPFGGAQTMAYMLAKGFAKIPACEASVLVYDYGQSIREVREGVVLVRNPNKRLSKYLTTWDLLKRRVRDRLNALIQRVEITSYYEKTAWSIFKEIDADMYLLFGVSKANYNTAIKLKKLGYQWAIMLAHDEDVSRSYYAGSTFRNRHNQLGEACYQLISMTDRFVAQNEFQLNELKDVFGKNGILINTPIDLSDASDSERKYILWVGRATDVKRPELFLDLARLLPNEQFVMVTSDSDRERYAYLVQHAPSNLSLQKNIPFNRIDSFFKKAKLLVNTSISEGFPVTFLHAGKFGVPVYTLGVDPNGILSKQKGGMVLKNIVEFSLYLDASLLLEFGKKLNTIIKENHDLKSLAYQVLSYIRQSPINSITANHSKNSVSPN